MPLALNLMFPHTFRGHFARLQNLENQPVIEESSDHIMLKNHSKC